MLITEKHMDSRAMLKFTDSSKRKALQALAWYGLVHRRMKAQRKEVAIMFNQRLWIQRWYDALVNKATGESELVGQSFQAGEIEALPYQAEQDKPNSHWVTRSQTQVSFGDLLRPQFEKPSKIERIKKILSPNREDRLMRSHDMPLQMTTSSEEKTMGQSTKQLRELLALETGEELRQAHDELSFRLQTMLSADEENQEAKKEQERLTSAMHFLRVRFELKDVDDNLKMKVMEALKHRVNQRKARRASKEALGVQAKCFAAL